MRSRNPVLGTVLRQDYVTDNPVTYANVTYKSLFLIALVFISAFVTLTYVQGLSIGVLIGAVVVGFISVIIGTRSVNLSPLFASIYAIAEGVVLAVVSALYASVYEGIVPTALTTTFIVFVIMLLLYSTRIVKVTQRFASIAVVALISIIFMSIIALLIPSVFGGTFFLVIVIASSILSAIFLLLDFASIENCVQAGADAKYGWILSLGLLVTIVWIYVEMLRLLAILSRRR